MAKAHHATIANIQINARDKFTVGARGHDDRLSGLGWFGKCVMGVARQDYIIPETIEAIFLSTSKPLWLSTTTHSALRRGLDLPWPACSHHEYQRNILETSNLG